MITEHRCWVYGDDVNTDVIFPGRYTYTLREPAELVAHALEDLDPAFARGVRAGDAIVAGANWGCGSSREQAVTALKACGVALIVADSFSRIYFRNCVNQGLLPVTLPDLHTRVKTGDMLVWDHDAWTIHVAGETYAIPRLPPSVQAILDAGGLLPMLQRRFRQEGT